MGVLSKVRGGETGRAAASVLLILYDRWDDTPDIRRVAIFDARMAVLRPVANALDDGAAGKTWRSFVPRARWARLSDSMQMYVSLVSRIRRCRCSIQSRCRPEIKRSISCLCSFPPSHAADSQDAKWRTEQQQQCRAADCRGRTQRASARPAAWKLQQPSFCQPVDASGDSDRHAVCLQHDPQTILYRPRRCSACCSAAQPIRFLVSETS